MFVVQEHLVFLFQDCFVHILNVSIGDGQVICRIVLSLVAQTSAPYIELQMSLERDHVSGDVHIVKLLKFADPHTVWIPDLGVDNTGLVL